jgi:hypothetical protein
MLIKVAPEGDYANYESRRHWRGLCPRDGEAGWRRRVSSPANRRLLSHLHVRLGERQEVLSFGTSLRTRVVRINLHNRRYQSTGTAAVGVMDTHPGTAQYRVRLGMRFIDVEY